MSATHPAPDPQRRRQVFPAMPAVQGLHRRTFRERFRASSGSCSAVRGSTAYGSRFLEGFQHLQRLGSEISVCGDLLRYEMLHMAGELRAHVDEKVTGLTGIQVGGHRTDDPTFIKVDWLSIYAIKVSMAGRPRKHENRDLTLKVERFRGARGLTYSELAQTLGVHCATLTRSVSTNLYSRDMEARLDQLLATGQTTEDPLLLLRKFVDVMPDLANALRSVLDTRERAE